MRDNQYGKQAGLRGFEGTSHATIICNIQSVLANLYHESDSRTKVTLL